MPISLQEAVNAAGALLFALVGVFALVVGRRSPRARFVAIAALGVGVPLVVFNLWVEPTRRFLLAQGTALALASLAILPLAYHLARDLGGRSRALFAALSAAIIAGYAASVAAMLRDSSPFATALGPELEKEVATNLVLFAAFGASLMVVVAAAAVRSRSLPPDAASERGALALLGVAFGAYPLVYFAPFHLAYFQTMWTWLGFLPTVVAWVGAAPPERGATARNASLALIACAILGMLFWGPIARMTGNNGFVDYGVPGALRTMGAFLLALAIFRHGLLQVELPTSSVRSGPIVAVGLASLLVVAQIVQSFLSAQLGLVVGGIVAGGLVLAARPIERALDQRTPRARAKAAAEHERSFRAAARRFYARDGMLSREEERELMVLADHLGVPAARAYEIRDEVEKETRAPGASR